ncbi:glucose-methanol-choline oxidoreductase-like protein [Pholiota conissans]|uniref:pyranose dehydrogenase (acceptor) n=1 Tax=Pholiota conissans TaxID=109636 RepID=A0A9P5YZT4_9AGAR|nr:glucose-methanol-choline oxidoreductase-like protein [Pholiota conissans]
MRLNLKGVSFFTFLLTAWSSTLVSGSYVQGRDLATSNSTTTSNSTNTEYDYIVVGSGPGGGPLAARLAQAGYSVLLIDAGGDHGEDVPVKVPAFFAAASEYAPTSWQYFVNHYSDLKTAEQDSKFTFRKPDGGLWVGPNPPAGSKPLGVFYPRAGTLGGCAEHNALILIYPHESDWNNIASLTGDKSWSADNMRKYFVKLENNQYLTLPGESKKGHGFNGWLDSTTADPRTFYRDSTIVGLLKGGAKALGKLTNLFDEDLTIPGNLAKVVQPDMNIDAPNRDLDSDFSQIPLSVTNSTRARSSQRQLILNTANTHKLKVQLNTLVTRVLFDNSTVPRAIGVEYQTGQHLYRADPNSASGVVTGSGSFFAKREVIISSGTFNTPQILKLSGIGPSAELKAHKIPVVHDSPAVGTNMQDRYEVSVVSTVPKNFTVFEGCTFLNTTDDACFAQWNTNTTDRGFYGSDLVPYGYTQKSSVADPSLKAVDLITASLPGVFRGYFPGWANATFTDTRHWSWIILKAHSRNNAGTVTLNSNDPRDVPLVNFNSFTNGGDQDLQAAYEAILQARKALADAEPFVGKIEEEIPGPNVTTEAQIKQFIRNEAWGHHASCSVPIGPASDTKKSVLDSNFKVKGVNGLRVVDASVFPKIPSLYIVSAIYMISEKAADVIIQDARA